METNELRARLTAIEIKQDTLNELISEIIVHIKALEDALLEEEEDENTIHRGDHDGKGTRIKEPVD